MKEKLAALYGLQQKDTALALLQRQYAALDKGQDEQAAYDQAKALHTEADTALTATTTEIRATELEQQSVETKRKEYETKLYSGKVTNAKELQAMQDEVEMLGRYRSKLDEKLLGLMESLEADRQREAAAKKTLSEAKSALKIKKEAYKQDAEAMIAQARTGIEERNKAAQKIPADLYKRYESLRAAKNGIAIAAIVDGNTCGGCKMTVPSTLVSLVREGDNVEVCQYCGRMLTILSKEN